MTAQRVRKTNQYIWKVIFGIQPVLFCVLIAATVSDSDGLQGFSGMLTCLICLALLICIFMYFSIMRSRRISTMHRLVLMMIGTESIYLFSDAIYFFTENDSKYRNWNTADNIVYCICPIVLLLLLWLFLDEWIGRAGTGIKACADHLYKAIITADILSRY